jgi:hypothetical protein
MKINDCVEVIFDNDWLEEYQMEHVVVSPVFDNMGAVIASSSNNRLFKVTIFYLHLDVILKHYTLAEEFMSLNFMS